MLARFRISGAIVTPFTAAEFNGFCKEQTIEYVTTPPYHSKSNGYAEKFEDTFKKNLEKIKWGEMEDSLQEFLAVYRQTPNTLDGTSPAEQRFNRKKTSRDYDQIVSMFRGIDKLCHINTSFVPDFA